MNDVEISLEKLFDLYNVATVAQLSNKIDVSQKTISNWKIRNSISAMKKKCRELGIYNKIFGDSTTFTQTGSNSQQIQTQNNQESSHINSFNMPSSKKDETIKYNMIDEDLLPLFEALNKVAEALNKKEQLKHELTSLISKLPTL